MLAYSSNNLQPLNVSVFVPLKKAYGSLVKKKMRQGYHHINKIDFIKIYPKAHREAFTLGNITKAFSATGLIPFNPEEVLGWFTIQLNTPTPPGSQSTNSAPKMPHNFKQLEKLKGLLNHPQSPSSSKATLDQLIKGCEMAFNGGALLAQENQHLQTIIEELQQKKKQSHC
jgi:hypothetical protein